MNDIKIIIDLVCKKKKKKSFTNEEYQNAIKNILTNYKDESNT